MLKFGQIGCGYWGPNLVRAINRIPDASLKCVCDTNESRLDFITSNFPSISVTKKPLDVITDPTIDCVIIATPVHTHFGIASQALMHGKHVFVEKPMAKTVAEVDALCELAAKQNLILFSGHTFLYHGILRAIKESYLKDLGELFYCYSKRLNLGKIRTDVNAWWNLAPHDISMLIYLMDEAPCSISVSGQDFIQSRIEDVSFATLEWSNGVVAHIQVSWLDPKKVRELTLVGSKRMLVFDDMSEYKLKVYEKGIEKIAVNDSVKEFDEPTTAFTYRNSRLECPIISFKEPLVAEMEHLVACIKEGKEPLTGPGHTRMVVQTLEAGDLSQKRGGEKIYLEAEALV